MAIDPNWVRENPEEAARQMDVLSKKNTQQAEKISELEEDLSVTERMMEAIGGGLPGNEFFEAVNKAVKAKRQEWSQNKCLAVRAHCQAEALVNVAELLDVIESLKDKSASEMAFNLANKINRLAREIE